MLMRVKKRMMIAPIVAAFAMAIAAPSAASAQPDVGTRDAQVSNWWSNMYLSGYPSLWHAAATNSIPGNVNYYRGHFQITGPNGKNYNTADTYSPQATTSGTGVGQVCANLWIKETPSSGYVSWGNACANVY
jgi:hypothetical protein